MNLLNYKNRFKQTAFTTTNVSEVNGYLLAMQDLLEYLQKKTEFNPEKRYIDSVELLEAITDTNSALMEVYQKEGISLTEALNELAGVDYGGSKVSQFLKEQTSDIPEDLYCQLRASEIL